MAVSSRPPEALKTVVEAATMGVSVLSLCEKGDAFIMQETGKVFKKEKDMKKGNALWHVCVRGMKWSIGCSNCSGTGVTA